MWIQSSKYNSLCSLSWHLCKYSVFVTSNLINKLFIVHSFIGISQTLLTTSYVKMIDIWMIYTMMVPFLEVVFISYKQISKTDQVTNEIRGKYMKIAILL